MIKGVHCYAQVAPKLFPERYLMKAISDNFCRLQIVYEVMHCGSASSLGWLATLIYEGEGGRSREQGSDGSGHSGDDFSASAQLYSRV